MGTSHAFGSQVGAPSGSGNGNNNPPPNGGNGGNRGNTRRGRGRGGAPVSNNNIGQGIENIRTDIRRLQSQRGNLEQEIQNDYQAAQQLATEATKCKGAACESKKKQAVFKLKSKKMKENNLVHLEKAIEQLEHQIATIEAAEVGLIMTKALKTAATTLTSVITETGIDEVVTIRDDLDENMARIEEINGLLYGEDEEQNTTQFEDELAAMMGDNLEEELDNIEIPTGGSLRIIPTANTTTTTTTTTTSTASASDQVGAPVAPNSQQPFTMDPYYLHQMQQLQLQQQQQQQQQSYFMLPTFGGDHQYNLDLVAPLSQQQPQPLLQPQYIQPYPQVTTTTQPPVSEGTHNQGPVVRGPLTAESMGF